MRFLNMKLVGVLIASVALLCTGPAWSASVSHKKAKSALKHKHRVKSSQAKAAKIAKAAKTALAMPAVAVAAETAPTGYSQTGYVPNSYAPSGSAPAAYTQNAYVPAAPSANPYLAPAANPYLVYQQQPAAPANPMDNASQFARNLKSLLPSIPEGQSILPSIKKVYPTGEKPLVVVTFKCPTELIGITPIPTKILHEVVNGGMDIINSTNLLSFNMQQVCQ